MKIPVKIGFTIGPVFEILLGIFLLTESIDFDSDLLMNSLVGLKIAKWSAILFFLIRIWFIKQMNSSLKILWTVLFILFGTVTVPLYAWVLDHKYQNKSSSLTDKNEETIE
ncbi:MAG: hypothetical protein NXI20_15620 [bacterium]|nr:hypothetical protein [bacterium]